MTGEASIQRRRQGIAVSTMGTLDKADLDVLKLSSIADRMLRLGRVEEMKREARQRRAARTIVEKHCIEEQHDQIKVLVKTNQFRIVLVGILVGAALSIMILKTADAAGRYVTQLSQRPGIVDMYQEVRGYLERDEQSKNRYSSRPATSSWQISPVRGYPSPARRRRCPPPLENDEESRVPSV